MIVLFSKRTTFFRSLGLFFSLCLIVLLAAGCGGSDRKGASSPGESDPKFSLPLPKGISAPLPDSDLTLTARAIIDPGTAGARTVDLTVDLSTNRVTGVIDGVAAGPHTVEIQYFMNQVQIATVTLNADVVPGRNNPVDIAPALIHYIETVSDALFVADAADPSIKILDHYSSLPGGRVSAGPTRTLKGERTGITGPSAGGLFVDSIGGGLYFADAQANSVSVWNHAAAVDGNTPPDRVLEGPATRLLQPTGIVFDPFRNRLYVANRNGEILIWSNASSLAGEVPPTAVIAGLLTGLTVADHPLYLDVKTHTLYVANGSNVLVFEKPGLLTGEQDMAPVRTLQIAGLSQAGLAGDPIQDLLFVSSRDANGTIHQLAGASAASGEVLPAAALAGAETGLNQTSAVTLVGDVLMALSLGGSEIRVWHQADQKNGNASPTQILELDQTSLPTALFYVATQNGARDQTQQTLEVQKSGSGHGNVTSDLPGINCGTTCAALFATGDTVTLAAAVEDDSTFDGWGGACNGTDTCVVTMDSAKTVTATFTLKPYALSVSRVGTGTGTVTGAPAGINCGNDCSESYDAHTQVTLTATPSTDSDFTGWTGACSGTGNCVVTLDAAQSVTAAFTLRTFALTVTKSGNGVGTVISNPAGIDCGSGAGCSASYDAHTQVTLTAAANANSNFSGWGGACTGSAATCIVTMEAARSVTATFTLKSFTLNVTKTGNGTVTSNPAGINCGTGCNQSYNINTQVTLTAAAATDSDFTSWSGCDTANGTSCTVNMNAAKSVTATFNLKTFTLTLTKSGTGTGTVTSNPTGIDCGAICSHAYVINTSVTLTAAPDADSDFISWSGCDSSTGNACTVAVNAAKSVTVTFNLEPLLTLRKAGNGSGTASAAFNSSTVLNCEPTCSTISARFDRGTIITLTATPAAGSTFTGWSGNVADCNDGSVTMTASRNCVATFTLIQHTLTITQSGNGTGTVSGAGNYNFGAMATVTSTANPGSTFSGWSGPNGAECATGSVTMNANNSCTATFTLNTFDLTVAKAGSGAGTVTSNPGGINCGTDCSETYNINTQVTLTANQDSSSLFAGWSGACTGTGNCVVTMDAAKTVTATFTLQTFPLSVTESGTGSGTVTSSPAGIDCGTDCTQDYTLHTVVTLTATPAADAVFAGWAGACTNLTGDCVVTMDAAQSVEAKFTRTFTLTVSLDPAGLGLGRVASNPAGIDCIASGQATCSAVYTFGTAVTLTATDGLLSHFSGWTAGACTGTDPICVLEMTSNQSTQARFDLLP